MTVNVRFAPSPTGLVHVGNLRAALFNWLYAKKEGGTFTLRLDDTDTERSTQEYADKIEADLGWLGLTHDKTFRQSDRFDRYAEVVEKLKAEGRLYPCYETPDELDRKRKRQLGRKLPPVYDRAALELSDEEKAALEAEGRLPHWRFKLDPEVVEFDDLFLGPVKVDTKSLSDPILIRGDGSYLYTLPSVVDDIDMGMTHIVRGEDHVTNTGAQVQVFRALGAEPPRFGHHSLLLNEDGKPLSKRHREDFSIEALREKGFEPMSVNSFLAKLGTPDAAVPRASLEELAADFDFSVFGRSAVRFDLKDVERVNATLMHMTPFETVKDRLAERGIGGGEEFWVAVRPNLTLFDGVAEWWHVAHGPVEPVIEADDRDFIAASAAALPPEPWDETTWKSWTGALKEETGRKGKTLFMPLRLALTGLRHGPELANLLPLLGRERAMARLGGEKA
jgi:glutamyl-tRNA synthetase